MTAVDTNVLVYAHRSDMPMHSGAASCLRSLAESPVPWAIPWPCVHEFLAVVTNPRVFDPPTSPAGALAQVAAWFESPSLYAIGETQAHIAALSRTILESGVRGGAVHDARIAAICLQHGVKRLVSLDRDFSRFPELHTAHPSEIGT